MTRFTTLAFLVVATMNITTNTASAQSSRRQSALNGAHDAIVGAVEVAIAQQRQASLELAAREQTLLDKKTRVGEKESALHEAKQFVGRVEYLLETLEWHDTRESTALTAWQQAFNDMQAELGRGGAADADILRVLMDAEAETKARHSVYLRKKREFIDECINELELDGITNASPVADVELTLEVALADAKTAVESATEEVDNAKQELVDANLAVTQQQQVLTNANSALRRALEPAIQYEQTAQQMAGNVTLQELVDKVGTQNASMIIALTGLGTKIDGVKSSIQSVATNVDKVADGVDSVATSVNGVRTEVAGLREDLRSANSAIGRIVGAIDRIKLEVPAARQAAQALHANVNATLDAAALEPLVQKLERLATALEKIANNKNLTVQQQRHAVQQSTQLMQGWTPAVRYRRCP